MGAYFREKSADNGFDKHRTPVWQMVPLNGSRSLDLVGAEGAIVLNLTPHVVEVVEGSGRDASHRLIALWGRRPGRATINVVSADGRQLTKLEVSVRPKKPPIKIAMNFVKDIRSATRQVRRAWGDSNYRDVAAETMETLNEVFMPQANIPLTLHSARIVTVNQDLGDVVWAAEDGVMHCAIYGIKTALSGAKPQSYKQEKTEWNAVVSKRDASADINVFFVWGVESTGIAAALAGLAYKGDCLCQDVGRTIDGLMVAHEVGHCLGLDHDGRADLLMNPDGDGSRLTKTEIERIKLPRR
jgi:hypothetical protein